MVTYSDTPVSLAAPQSIRYFASSGDALLQPYISAESKAEQPVKYLSHDGEPLQGIQEDQQLQYVSHDGQPYVVDHSGPDHEQHVPSDGQQYPQPRNEQSAEDQSAPRFGAEQYVDQNCVDTDEQPLYLNEQGLPVTSDGQPLQEQLPTDRQAVQSMDEQGPPTMMADGRLLQHDELLMDRPDELLMDRTVYFVDGQGRPVMTDGQSLDELLQIDQAGQFACEHGQPVDAGVQALHEQLQMDVAAQYVDEQGQADAADDGQALCEESRMDHAVQYVHEQAQTAAADGQPSQERLHMEEVLQYVDEQGQPFALGGGQQQSHDQLRVDESGLYVDDQGQPVSTDGEAEARWQPVTFGGQAVEEQPGAYVATDVELTLSQPSPDGQTEGQNGAAVDVEPLPAQQPVRYLTVVQPVSQPVAQPMVQPMQGRAIQSGSAECQPVLAADRMLAEQQSGPYVLGRAAIPLQRQHAFSDGKQSLDQLAVQSLTAREAHRQPSHQLGQQYIVGRTVVESTRLVQQSMPWMQSSSPMTPVSVPQTLTHFWAPPPANVFQITPEQFSILAAGGALSPMELERLMMMRGGGCSASVQAAKVTADQSLAVAVASPEQQLADQQQHAESTSFASHVQMGSTIVSTAAAAPAEEKIVSSRSQRRKKLTAAKRSKACC